MDRREYFRGTVALASLASISGCLDYFDSPSISEEVHEPTSIHTIGADETGDLKVEVTSLDDNPRYGPDDEIALVVADITNGLIIRPPLNEEFELKAEQEADDDVSGIRYTPFHNATTDGRDLYFESESGVEYAVFCAQYHDGLEMNAVDSGAGYEVGVDSTWSFPDQESNPFTIEDIPDIREDLYRGGTGGGGFRHLEHRRRTLANLLLVQEVDSYVNDTTTDLTSIWNRFIWDDANSSLRHEITDLSDSLVEMTIRILTVKYGLPGPVSDYLTEYLSGRIWDFLSLEFHYSGESVYDENKLDVSATFTFELERLMPQYYDRESYGEFGGEQTYEFETPPFETQLAYNWDNQRWDVNIALQLGEHIKTELGEFVDEFEAV